MSNITNGQHFRPKENVQHPSNIKSKRKKHARIIYLQAIPFAFHNVNTENHKQNQHKNKKILCRSSVCTQEVSFVSQLYFILRKGNTLPAEENQVKNAFKMSKFMCFVAVLCVVLLKPSDASAIHSDDKNIAKLLNNQVIVSRQILCVLDKSPCDQLGRQLKGMFVYFDATLRRLLFVSGAFEGSSW